MNSTTDTNQVHPEAPGFIRAQSTHCDECGKMVESHPSGVTVEASYGDDISDVEHECNPF